MSKLIRLAVCTAALGSAFMLEAKVSVAPVFTNNMVMQREMKAPVWGKADPGENVTVTFAGQTVKATAGKDGRWRADLKPLKTNAVPQEMKITGKANTITVKNILVGEVWLCSGQSNMEMPLNGGGNWSAVTGAKDAAGCANDLIRIVRMPYKYSITPTDNTQIVWSALTPKNAPGFSAAAFYFGTYLQKELKVPVGLISSHWGGTQIEPWTPPCGFDAVPELKAIANRVNSKIPGHPEYNKGYKQIVRMYEKYVADVKTAYAKKQVIPQPPEIPFNMRVYTSGWNATSQPSALYNHMIYPFVPFALRGAIWYQGCSNLGNGTGYGPRLKALLTGWRKVFENPEMSFYLVQLAPYSYGKPESVALPVFWETQEKFANSNGPKVGMVVINDSGNYNDIHPRFKRPVGERLARLALNRDYGRKDIKADSPILKVYKIKDGKFVMDFDHVEKFQAKGNAGEFFQLAGVDGIFYPAKVELAGKQLIVSCDKVQAPRLLRYMWKNCSEGRIFNEAGLPLGAFHIEPEIKVEEFLGAIAKDAKLLYSFNVKKSVYSQDNRKTFKEPFSKVLYYVTANTNSGKKQWVAVRMDAFTKDPMKLSIPAPGLNIIFQTKVKNMTVTGNVEGVKTGTFAEGNIEFWNGNYGGANAINIPGATNAYDFGDIYNAGDGYGSFQVHNFLQKQTVFSYSNLRAGGNADFGFGNAPGPNPDWTFTGNLKNYSQAQIFVYLIK